MIADERLDDLLDDWAELAERNHQVDLDAFIRDHAADLDDEARKRFRKRAAALARMNQRLDALQDTHSFPSDTSEPGNAPSLLAELKPGYEPLEGYKLVERLGRGGFGEVWKATDTQGFSVAIKFVPLSGKYGETELRSLEVMKDVRHPHLLSIVRVAPRDDVLVIAMKLADRSLADRLEEAKKEGYNGIPHDELLEYMTEAAKGIDYLNDPGTSGRPRIQHRDIKPANLLLSGNSVKIADYSLAQALTFNVAESIGSTPAYAAPEFFDGSTTSRSDQYSLAITYCHLRGGRVPFEGSIVELMEAHRNREPDPDMLPPEERPVVARALSKKSKDRWPTCAAFVEALKKAVAPPPVESSAGFTGLLHNLNELPTKTKAIAGTTAASLIVLVLLFVFSGGNGSGPPTESETAESAQESALAADDAKQPLTVAVLDFANHSQDPALDGYRLGFRDMLTTDLSKLSSIKVLERVRLESLLKEHNLAKTDFYVAATKKDRSLAQLVTAASGAAVRLKAEGGISGWDHVVIEKWDLSAEKAEPKSNKTSAVEMVEPRTLSVADFQLQERVEDSEIRQYLESQVKTHLARFDPSLTSTPRYFSSVALLAQIAGRIGHRPLEDALTRKWWSEIRPLSAPDASVAYEQASNKSRRRDRVAESEPLLSELKTLIRKESNELWFNSKVLEVSSLPKAERAPDSEPGLLKTVLPVFYC